jgi:ubiquinol-cytochrome c reductase iron-sulfur subunit
MNTQPDASRRDFLSVCTGCFATAGAACTTWPFVAQLAPSRAVAAESIAVDLPAIRPGQSITIAWRQQPIIIRHRTAEEIAIAGNGSIESLPDPLARNATLPSDTRALDANRTRAGRPEWLVVVGICTHLGCRLGAAMGRDVTSGVGWFCPCHAARFDLSGRVRSGPARTNLPIPPYRFLAAAVMEIGRA